MLGYSEYKRRAACIQVIVILYWTSGDLTLAKRKAHWKLFPGEKRITDSSLTSKGACYGIWVLCLPLELHLTCANAVAPFPTSLTFGGIEPPFPIIFFLSIFTPCDVGFPSPPAPPHQTLGAQPSRCRETLPKLLGIIFACRIRTATL